MMVGETRHLNPTVHVPPWPSMDADQTADIYSPLKYNAADSHFNNNGNPFHVQEALAALQRYLPTSEPDVIDSDSVLLSPDSPVDAYSCDHFRMYEFKVRRCSRGRSHDWTECPYAHPGEKARRRDPRKYHYTGTACADFRKGNCLKGDTCEFAHGVFECWLHPARYRTEPCKDGPSCKRRACFFAHSPDQLRVVNSAGPGWSSHSPLVSPRAESSPPVSPMAELLSRSLGSSSINEMITSLRNLQLGKVKSIPASWNTQVGFSSSSSPSVYGSPREAVVQPVFCSLPNTPTRKSSRTGLGYLDFWGKWCEEEEPAMERVESGRDLRARVLEKLSKGNPLERAYPGQCSGDPNVDWVSDLVK
ncbi:hypothetical protein GQ457_10G017120 [Hibiscus cannabinus]